MKTLLSLITMVLLLAGVAAAADISGTWKGTAEGPQGKIERTFMFKQDGSNLSGETSSEFTGKSAIQNGKVDGDNVSFSITANIQGNDMKLNYKGKLTGAELKLTVSTEDGSFTVDYIAKTVN